MAILIVFNRTIDIMSFSSTDQRVYLTNNRIQVFDYNTELSRIILDDVHDVSGHAIRTSITGTINVNTDISGQTILVGNFPVLQGVTGTVSIANFPATQPVSGLVSVTGSVAADISGQSVNIANFPATQPVSGLVSVTGSVVADISGQTVAVSNFPATQPVSGLVSVTGSVAADISGQTIAVSNFPATQPVSGLVSVTGSVAADISGQSVNIANFPATQPVSGLVSVTGSVAADISGQTIAVSNFPATQPVSGLVSVTGSVAADISGQTIAVSNFPATQPVSGLVSVTGTVATDISGQAVVVSNFPATQPVSGLVSVTGSVAADISGQTIAVSNFPATQPVSGLVSVTGSVAADISGQTIVVSNFPATQPVSGLVSVTGSVAADISGQTINVAGTSFTTGSLNVNVTNPIGITGIVDVSGSFSADISGQTILVGNFPLVQTVSVTGTANVYDSSANATLATIEADLSGGIISKGVDDTGTAYSMYTDANGVQRTEIVTGHIETAKYVFETDASVIASSSGAGWSIDVRGRKGWYYDATAVSTLKWYGNNGISSPPVLEFNKAQSVFMIATMDQTSLLPKIRLNTTASTWDYTLPAASSIYNGETYLFYYGNKAINLHPSVSPLLMTRTLISGPGANNEVISEINIVTATSGTNGSKFLLASAGLYDQDLMQQFETVFENTRAFRAETNLLGLGFTGTSLLTNITNFPATQQVSVTGSVNVSGVSNVSLTGPTYAYSIDTPGTDFPLHIKETVSNGNLLKVISMDVTGGTPTYVSTNSLLDDIKTNTGNIDTKLPANLTVSSNKLQVIDSSGGATLTSIDGKLPANLTVTSNKLQVYDSSGGATLTSIDGKLGTQTGQLGSVGLRIYDLMPVSKAYTLNGSSGTGGTAILGFDTALSFATTNTYKFGLAGGHSWYAKTTVVNRTLTYEYIDTSGNVGTNTVSLTAGSYSGVLALQGGGSGTNAIVSINKWSVDPAMLTVSSATTYLSIDSASDANAIGGGNYLYMNTGVFTCPPNARAFVSFVRLSCVGAADSIALIHYDVNGLRTTRHVFQNVPAGSSIYFNSGSSWGSIGGFIEAGESILFGGNSSATGITGRYASATIQVFYY